MVTSRSITVHGITATVFCADSELVTWFEFDFRYFLQEETISKAEVSLQVDLGPIPPKAIPPLDEVMHTRSFACFEAGSKRYIDYQGRALVIFDYANNSGIIY